MIVLLITMISSTKHLLTTMQQIALFTKPLLYLQGCEMKSEWKHKNATQMHTSMRAPTKMYQLQSCLLGNGHTRFMLAI